MLAASEMIIPDLQNLIMFSGFILNYFVDRS